MSIVVNKTRLPVTNWQTKSGAIVSIDDARQRIARSLKVNMLPQQDLHGYDNPWPPGGGKNKFDPTAAVVGAYINDSTGAETTAEGSVASGYIPVVGGETYIISPQKATGNWGAWYDDGKVFISGFTGYVSAKTAPQNAKYMRITVNRNDNEPNWATVTQIELGSTATSYAPYSNLCPISGHTGVDAYVDGKNLLSDIKNDWSFIGGSYGYIGGVVPKAQTAIMSFTDKDTSVDISDISIGFVYDNTSIGQLATKFRWTMQAGTVKSDTTNVAQNDSTTLCQNVMIYPKSQEAWDRLFARYNIQVELGTTSSAYNPYVTTKYQVSFPAVGANQWDEELESGYLGVNGTTIAYIADNSRIRSKNWIPVLPNTTYCYVSGGAGAIMIGSEDTTGQHCSVLFTQDTIANYKTFTTGANTHYLKFCPRSSYGSTYNHDIAINYPSSVTTYEPYTTTVYSGTLDLVSGELVVDRAMVDLGTLNWTYFNIAEHYRFVAYPQGIKDFGSNVNANIICSSYAVDTANNVFNNVTDKRISSGGGAVLLFDSAYTDATSFKTAMSGVQLVYELATPITYHLTPQQIHMLVRDNTIWSDADSVEVEYAAVHQHV